MAGSSSWSSIVIPGVSRFHCAAPVWSIAASNPGEKPEALDLPQVTWMDGDIMRFRDRRARLLRWGCGLFKRAAAGPYSSVPCQPGASPSQKRKRPASLQAVSLLVGPE